MFPDNAKRNKPAVLGSYVLMSGDTGETLAVMDGAALTAWRTACASALAARYLAREDASHLVMIGAGALGAASDPRAPAVRPITRVTLWNRTRSHAISTAFALSAAGIEPTSPTIWKKRCARPTSCPARRCRPRRSFAAPG